MTFPFPSHYLPSRTVVASNSFYCLGHFKNVCDDDDDISVLLTLSDSFEFIGAVEISLSIYLSAYLLTLWPA